MANWNTQPVETLLAPLKNAIAMGPFGSRIKAENFVTTGVPVIKGGNLNSGYLDETSFDFLTAEKAEELKASKARSGDLVFTHRGTIGQVGLISERAKFQEYIVSQSQLKLSLDPSKVDPYFAYYFFKSPTGQSQLLANASQVGVPAIARASSSIKKIEFPICSLVTQRLISKLLRSLDDKIELNRQKNEALEALARALFQDWFVDFGPTRRKNAGETDPVKILGHAIPEPTRATEIADLFPALLGDDGLPEGWSWTELGDLAFLNPECWTAKIHPSEVNYVDLANTKWGTIDATTHYLWEDCPSRARRILMPGDTVVGTVRPGNGSYARIHEEGLTGSTGFAVLRAKTKVFEDIVYLAATSSKNIKGLSNLANGGAYPAVRPDVVLKTPIPSINQEIGWHFSEIIEPIFRLRAASTDENHILAKIRDLLLPELMSGKVLAAHD